MITTKRKYPSAKNITEADVNEYVENLKGWPLPDEQKKLLAELNKKYGLVVVYQGKKFELHTREELDD